MPIAIEIFIIIPEVPILAQRPGVKDDYLRNRAKRPNIAPHSSTRSIHVAAK